MSCFRLISQRIWQTLGWMNPGVRRGFQHGLLATGQHPRRTASMREKVACRSATWVCIDHRDQPVRSIPLRARRDAMIATWKTEGSWGHRRFSQLGTDGSLWEENLLSSSDLEEDVAAGRELSGKFGEVTEREKDNSTALFDSSLWVR